MLVGSADILIVMFLIDSTFFLCSKGRATLDRFHTNWLGSLFRRPRPGPTTFLEDVEIAMIDSLALQPALGWYQVPFWLGDVCPRGRRHDVLNRRSLILFLGSVELTRGVRPRETWSKNDLRRLVSAPTRAAHVSGLVSRERRLRARAEFARDDSASRRFVEDPSIEVLQGASVQICEP